MEVTNQAPSGNFSYVHDMFDTCSGFTYALELTGEKATNAIKVPKSSMLILVVPWAIKTDIGPAYTSQKFHDYVDYWKITHLTGILYIPQGQAIVEHGNLTIKESVAWVISLKAKQYPSLALVEELFYINFHSIDEVMLRTVFKHWTYVSRDTPLPLVR